MQVSQVRGAKQDVPKCDSHLWQCPGSPRSRGRGPGGNHTLEQNIKQRGDGEAGSKNLEKWQDGRLLRHLGGSCGLRARLLRCLDGPKQQRSATHTYGPALGQQ